MYSNAMLLTCFAFSLATVGQDLPDKATSLYTGVPISSPSAGVQMVTHNASASLTKTDVSLDSLTYLKNFSDQNASITVTIPIEGHDVEWGMTDKVQVSATIDNEPVMLTKKDAKIVAPSDEKKTASGIRAETYWQAYTMQVNFVGKAAHALRIHYSGPVGHAGLDGTQRTIAYDISGASSWSAPVSQLNFSLKYTPSTVFQVFSTRPKGEWQVGPTGAFIKELNARPAEDSKFLFTYYQGGYEKIGG